MTELAAAPSRDRDYPVALPRHAGSVPVPAGLAEDISGDVGDAGDAVQGETVHRRPCLVVGGEIMQAKHLVLDAVIERAKAFSFGPSFDSTSIVEGALDENAAAAGAALLADHSE